MEKGAQYQFYSVSKSKFEDYLDNLKSKQVDNFTNHNSIFILDTRSALANYFEQNHRYDNG